jgi:hypothetical protein
VSSIGVEKLQKNCKRQIDNLICVSKVYSTVRELNDARASLIGLGLGFDPTGLYQKSYPGSDGVTLGES